MISVLILLFERKLHGGLETHVVYQQMQRALQECAQVSRKLPIEFSHTIIPVTQTIAWFYKYENTHSQSFKCRCLRCIIFCSLQIRLKMGIKH